MVTKEMTSTKWNRLFFDPYRYSQYLIHRVNFIPKENTDLKISHTCLPDGSTNQTIKH